MAIAFDAASGIQSANTVSSLTYSFTCTGTDRLLLVNVTVRDTTTTVTGVTYGGTAMTAHSSNPQATATPGEGRRNNLFILVNPASGANDVVISLSAATNLYSRAASYTGCKQTGQPDATGAATGNTVNTITMTVTTVADNCWLVGHFDLRGENMSAGANTTLRGTNSEIQFGDTNAAQTPAGSFSIKADTTSANNTGCTVLGYSIAPVAAAAAANHWLLMGV